MTASSSPYDVVVLGSGIAGSMLGAVLARHGARVMLLDAGTHPKFAIGESTIPYTLVALRTIAERYDVPEIKTLATFSNCTRRIAPSFGVKKHFGFLIHHEGRDQNPRETNQFNTPGLLHEASHMFRQDTDAYVFHVALRYGCHQRQNSAVVDVEFDDAGATVTSARGEQFRARYVVDASGFRSPLADRLHLRDEPCRFNHHSRSVWNHMVGVTPTDELFNHPRQDRPPVPWYQGTVHHMFDRGWFWVIGFDNHKASRSPLCSVGLTLDPRKYPKDPSQSPAEDFLNHAARFPDIARQYTAAQPVREWTSTDRLQYSSRQVVGDRWCLLSHAAAFIDPLFSRGLSNTAETINALAWRLLAAVRDDDFSAKRFEYIERLQQGLFDFNDDLVNSAFISFADYELWSAVFRIWAWGSNAGTFRLQKALTKFLQDGRDTHLRDLEEAPHLGFYWPDHDGYRKLFDQMVGQCEAVEAGSTSSSTAADTLHELLVMSDFVPRHFGFSDRSRRYLHPTPMILLKTILLAHRKADPRVRELMFGVGKDALVQKLRGRRIF